MQAFAIIRALLPIIQGIIRAAKKNSPGGKKVTKEEVEALLVEHLDDIAAAVFKAAQS